MQFDKKKVCNDLSLISITKVYIGKVRESATPTAASTIRITPMIVKTIPRILAISCSNGR